MQRTSETRPAKVDLDLIDAAYDDLRSTETLADWFVQYHKNHRSRLAIDLRMVRDVAHEGDTVVEFGATPCLLTHAAQAAGYRVIGIDLAPERMTARSGTLNVMGCDIEREPVPLDDGTADVVLFNELFEHLRIDLRFTLSEVARVMKPGGLLLLSTPNMQSLAGMNSLLRNNRSAFLCPKPYEEFGKLKKLGHMGHVREYTTRDVVEFLENFDVRTEKIIHRGMSSRLRWLQRLAPRLRPFFSVVARKSRDAAGGA